MTIGSRIAQYRKSLNITQEALAQQLNVSNQAVSKWESDQCCPDIQLLPALADIFQVSIDALFGREPAAQTIQPDLSWADDRTLHAVLFLGHKLVHNSTAAKEISFTYKGPALNISSAFSVNCGDVYGDVDAGGYVNCGNVGGDADAGGNISCGNIGGNADAGGSISGGNISGNADAGQSIGCGEIHGDADAGGNITCGNVGGDVDAGGSVSCSKIEGDVDAGGKVIIKN